MSDEQSAPEVPAGPPRSGKRRRRKGGGERRAAGHWMIVTSPDNFRRTRELGFSAQGVKRRHRRRMETLRPGDRILYYVTGRMAFAATATVTSTLFEDHTPIWRSSRREEDYPWRVHIRVDRQLPDERWIAARDIAFRMEYVRKWPPEHWTLAFQGNLHQLPRTDFQLIEGEFERQLARRREVAVAGSEG